MDQPDKPTTGQRLDQYLRPLEGGGMANHHGQFHCDLSRPARRRLFARRGCRAQASQRPTPAVGVYAGTRWDAPGLSGALARSVAGREFEAWAWQVPRGEDRRRFPARSLRRGTEIRRLRWSSGRRGGSCRPPPAANGSSRRLREACTGDHHPRVDSQHQERRQGPLTGRDYD